MFEMVDARAADTAAEDIYSKAIRAGRRTYFFDVKATRNDDYFISIAESRRVDAGNGDSYFEKHKIRLYKEDFEKFTEGLSDVMEYIRSHKPEFFEDINDDRTGIYEK